MAVRRCRDGEIVLLVRGNALARLGRSECDAAARREGGHGAWYGAGARRFGTSASMMARRGGSHWCGFGARRSGERRLGTMASGAMQGRGEQGDGSFGESRLR